MFFAVLILFVGIGFYFAYEKISLIDKCLLKVKIGNVISKTSNEKTSLESSSNLKSNKRVHALNELKKLKDYISGLKVDATFTERCLEKIESEIRIQEYIYFRELGEDTYKNSK